MGIAEGPPLSVTFNLDGVRDERILAMFSATFGQGSGQSPGRSIIRLLIDGVIQKIGAAEAVNVHDGDPISLGAFNFISAPLAPGTHTAVIQWRSAFGDSVCVDQRSLTILHR